MRNEMNLREMFNSNYKVMKLFLDYCKDNDNLCEYDLEHITMSLALGDCGVDRYFHFHTGNVLDWLESYGYYIGTPIRGNFKYVTVVQYKGEEDIRIGRPIYSNSGVVSRDRAIYLGVSAAIKDLEDRL